MLKEIRLSNKEKKNLKNKLAKGDLKIIKDFTAKI